MTMRLNIEDKKGFSFNVELRDGCNVLNEIDELLKNMLIDKAEVKITLSICLDDRVIEVYLVP